MVSASSSSSSSSSPKRENADEGREFDSSTTRLRPQTRLERITNVPRDVEKLYHHALRYKSIHDASMTPLNAWTSNHPMKGHKNSNNNNSMHRATAAQPEDSSFRTLLPANQGIWGGWLTCNQQPRPGRIPRQQYQQQLQTIEDFQTMLPLVALFLVPVIGYLPAVIAVSAPRQILSRQFHNAYEWEIFSQINFAQRKAAFMELGDLFWSTSLLPSPRGQHLFQTTNAATDCSNEKEGERHDDTGPHLDLLDLYSAFDDIRSPPTFAARHNPKRRLGPVRDLPREYLVRMATRDVFECVCVCAFFAWS
jgi:hypothetical protein